VFALKQALALYDFYTTQLLDCDRELERQFAATRPRFDPDDPDQPLGPDPKPNTHAKNRPAFDVRRQLFRLVGVDLVGVGGLDASGAQTLLSEIGTDMSRWPTAKHFCSWLGLAPHNEITGGKVRRSHTLKVHNRAAQVLRLAAQSLSRSPTALGAAYRSVRARLGPQAANTAIAHKLARIIYHLLTHRIPFDLQVLEHRAEQMRQRELANLRRHAAKLGLVLQPAPTGG